MLQTAERVSASNLSDNYVFQRSLLAYLKAAELVHGRVLEIGTGDGYGVGIIADKATEFITLDKHPQKSFIQKENVRFICRKFPQKNNPIFPSGSFDFVITFQVIEHIKKDRLFIQEIKRILKAEGKLIITTPNALMSLTRNPWHVREYTPDRFDSLLSCYFNSIERYGVFGNEKIMTYYDKNKTSVNKITRYDFLNLQHRLPRQLLQIPYDILNRINRHRLLNRNISLVQNITKDDYYLAPVSENCFDLFYIASDL